MFLEISSVNSNQTMLKQLNTNATNPNPKPNPHPSPPPFFFPFSTSLFTQDNVSEETHFVSQALNNFHTLGDTKKKPSRTPRKRKSDVGENPNPRKRTGKSDRHSKIFTAQGPRDRRMRLSVHIARKFFDLQDMLGFDKASKTIEWLFCQSRDAIREVALNHEPQISINHSSISNCENSFKNSFELGEKIDCDLNSGQVSQAKESRDKTRGRARERPREKLVGVDSFEVNIPTYIEDLGFLGYVDQGIHFPTHEVDMIGNVVGTDSSALNSIFDFDNDFTMSGGVDSCNFMGMFGNLEMMVPLTGTYVQEPNPNSHLYYQV